MNVLLPRLGRSEVDVLLDAVDEISIEEIAALMPSPQQFTYGAVGGVAAEPSLLRDLRETLVERAKEAGYPHDREQGKLRDFDADAARILHGFLPISPHEAGHREVWAALTAAHLLDIAAWRWGGISDRRRVNGDVNRDTFRRLWWRYEILQEPNDPWDRFGGLGEDEIVAIMERPGVAGNPVVARSIIRGFKRCLEEDPDLEAARMHLMRDAMKRLTRLTPFTALDALSDNALNRLVDEVMERASGALVGTVSDGSSTTHT